MKVGKAIIDNDIKMIKKIFKNLLLNPDFNDPKSYLIDSDLRNSTIKVTSIRKYKRYLRSNDFTYEVDVIVDMGNTDFWRSNTYAQRRVRRSNNYYRSGILKTVKDQLKYFGIGLNDDVKIIKIKYEDI
jgi:hypothetical protein